MSIRPRYLQVNVAIASTTYLVLCNSYFSNFVSGVSVSAMELLSQLLQNRKNIWPAARAHGEYIILLDGHHVEFCTSKFSLLSSYSQCHWSLIMHIQSTACTANPDDVYFRYVYEVLRCM
jgi:hypothetical protein